MNSNSPPERPASASQLAAAISRLEDVAEAIRIWQAASGAETDPRQLVEHRRQLSEAIANAGRIGEDYLLQIESDRLTDFRQHFSKLRSTVALHQAKWPAVRLGREANDVYHRSARDVQGVTAAFIRWVEAEIL